MKKYLLLKLLLILITTVNIQAQSVTIEPSGITPAPTPYQKLTFEQIQALTTMQTGDIVFDLTFKCLRLYNGAAWNKLLTADTNDADITAFGLTSADAQVVAIDHDSQNNIIIAGYFFSSIELSPTVTLTTTTLGVFIAKFNTEGVLLNYRKEESTQDLAVSDMHVDNNDNIYISGYYQGTTSLGSVYNFTSAGLNDIFICKYDSSLAIQWAKSDGGSGVDIPMRFSMDTYGNSYIYLSGYFEGTINFNGGSVSKTSAGGYDTFIAKYELTTGTLSWVTSFGGVNQDFPYDIEYRDGYVYIAGSFDISTTIGTDTYTSIGLDDIFFARFSSSGVYVDSFAGGGIGNDYAHTIVISNSESPTVYLAGQFEVSMTLGGVTVNSNNTNQVANAFLATIFEVPLPLSKARKSIASLGVSNIYTVTQSSTNENDSSTLTEAVADENGNIYLVGYTVPIISRDGFSTKSGKSTFVWKFDGTSTTSLASFPSSDGSRVITHDNLGNIFVASFLEKSTTIGNTYLPVPLNNFVIPIVRIRMN